MRNRVTAISLYYLYAGRLTAAFALVAVLSAFLYGFFLLEAVAHAAKETEAQKSIAALNAAVAELEGTYLDQTKSLTLQRATALGFVAPVEVATVYTGSGMLSLAGGAARP